MIIELILRQEIIFLQQILHRQGIMAGIKPGGSYGRITDPLDRHETTVTAGPGDPANATAATTGGRSATRS